MPRITKEKLEVKLQLYHDLNTEQKIKIELLNKEVEVLRIAFNSLARVISESKKRP